MDMPGGRRDAREVAGRADRAGEHLGDVMSLHARVTGPTPCERAGAGPAGTFRGWCAQHD
jgi:hypothetical protein